MFNKKNVGVAVYIIIISLFILSCMSLKTDKSIVKNNNELIVEKEYDIGAKNFVYLFKTVQPEIDCTGLDCVGMISSTASGLVFSSYRNVIFVLTAAHFCNSDEEFSMFYNEKIIGVASEKHRELHILKMNKEKDICMLFGLKEKDESYKNIKLAKELIVGEEVYSVAAPSSIGGPGIRLIFTGKLGGCDEEICMTTMPASFGSSGAGIYNSNHELITIIMAVPEDFKNVILSPSNKDIEKFIQDINNLVDIYSY